MGLIEDDLDLDSISRSGRPLSAAEILRYSRDRGTAMMLIEKYRDLLIRSSDKFGWPAAAIIVREQCNEKDGEEVQMKIAQDKELRSLPNVLNSLAIYGTDNVHKFILTLEEARQMDSRSSHTNMTPMHLVAKHTSNTSILSELRSDPERRNLKVNGGPSVESAVNESQANINWQKEEKTRREKWGSKVPSRA